LVAGLASLVLRAVVLLGDQPTVPAEDRIRCDDPSDLLEDLPSEHFAFHSQAAALVVVQANPAPSELFAENAVLFLEVVDHMLLSAVDPAGEHQEEEVECVRWGGRGHAGGSRLLAIKTSGASASILL
jgi:hypothetical protein